MDHLELTREDGLVLSTDPSRVDLDRVHAWLRSSYWASERDRATVERSISRSYPFGVYAPDGTQIAFARVTTDLTTFAWLGDVVVDDAWRGKGVGTWLVSEVISHMRGAGVPRFVLATLDAHGVYEKVGFRAMQHPERWMEIDLRPHMAPDAAAK